jgi:polyribonucleotide nucleotidyltransferase
MGSVCGSTLALMDAGVPIKAPVGGIAMGLVKEGDDYVILTDIQGAEDHLGDMDFKVAGTRDGDHRAQMDIKITGVTQEILRDALEQAKRARTSSSTDAEDDPEAREELTENAPRISTVKIDPEQDRLGHRQGRRDDPRARVRPRGAGRHRGGRHDPHLRHRRHEGHARDRRDPGADEGAEVGDTYTGKVVKTTDFGAFVELKKGTDGLLHVSNVGPGRVGHIEDVIARGDVLDVIVQEVDKERGRIGLKLVAKHENGNLVQPEELIERAKDAPPREREERPPRRDGDRGRGGRGGGRPRGGGRDR